MTSFWQQAITIQSDRPDSAQWMTFWQRTATVWGMLFVVAGLVCYIAWNWNGMQPMDKMGLVGACMLALCLPAGVWGASSRAGELGLLMASLCAGPLLAVFGQTYQSGADLWELFRVWAGLVFGLALVTRRPCLWFTGWLLGMTGYSLWVDAVGGTVLFWRPSIAWAFWGFCAAQAGLLMGWELVLRRARPSQPDQPDQPDLSGPHSGRRGGVVWMPRCLWFMLMLSCTWYVGRLVTSSSLSYLIEQGLPLFGLYAVCLGLGWWWYRWQRQDLFMLACGLFSLIAVGEVAVCSRLHFDRAFTLLVMGLLVAGGCGLGATLIRRWQWSMVSAQRVGGASGHVDDAVPGTGTGASTGAGTAAASQAELHKAYRLSLPWYSRCLQGFGSWVAALLLAFYLVVQFADNVMFTSDLSSALATGGVIFLVLARLLRRMRRGDAMNQLVLAFALAGTGALGAAMMLKVDRPSMFPALALLALLPGLVMAASATFSFMTGLVAVPLLFMAVPVHPVVCYALGLTLYGLVTCGVLRETDAAVDEVPDLSTETSSDISPAGAAGPAWLVKALGPRGLSPLLYGLYAGLPLPLCLDLYLGKYLLRWATLPAPGQLGLCAGAVLVCLVVVLVQPRGRAATEPWCWPVLEPLTRRNAGLLALALTCVPLGWFMPGLSLGVLSFMLARLRNSRVMEGYTVLWLAAFFWQYYYSLETTLLYKSCALVGSGLLLLGMGQVLVRLLKTAQPGTAHLGTAQQTASDQLEQQPDRQNGAARPAVQRRLARLLPALPVLVCVLFLVGVGVSAWQNEQRLRQDRLVLLPLAPRDPRAMLLGDYMALNYELNNTINALRWNSQAVKQAELAIVRLDDKGIGTFERFDDGTPLRNDEVRLHFRVIEGVAHAAPRRFYFQEGHGPELEKATYGELRVNEAGHSLLVDLRGDKLQSLSGTGTTR